MNSSLSTATKNDFYCYYEVKLITKHFMQKKKKTATTCARFCRVWGAYIQF